MVRSEIKIDIALLVTDYKEYKNKDVPRWKFANEILYNMCKGKMLHVEDDVIASKVFLIGRSYAVAVERQHYGGPKGDSYYYENVVNELKSLDIDGGLDGCIADIISKPNIMESLKTIFKLHDALSHFGHDSGNKDKSDDCRPSFASKYLHFHCPDKIFIYDDRARRAISRYIVSGKYELYEEYKNKDYQIFVYKALSILEQLLKSDSTCDPRELDNFLLWVEENVKSLKVNKDEHVSFETIVLEEV